MWERGLKSRYRKAGGKVLDVAPLVGAWIEIHEQTVDGKTVDVAPLVGAWIEMEEESKWKGTIIVAPLVGAWIEIFCGWNRIYG